MILFKSILHLCLCAMIVIDPNIHIYMYFQQYMTVYFNIEKCLHIIYDYKLNFYDYALSFYDYN